MTNQYLLRTCVSSLDSRYLELIFQYRVYCVQTTHSGRNFLTIIPKSEFQPPTDPPKPHHQVTPSYLPHSLYSFPQFPKSRRKNQNIIRPSLPSFNASSLLPALSPQRARTNHSLVTQNATMTPRRSHGNIVAFCLATHILRGRQRLDNLTTVSTSSFRRVRKFQEGFCCSARSREYVRKLLLGHLNGALSATDCVN